MSSTNLQFYFSPLVGAVKYLAYKGEGKLFLTVFNVVMAKLVDRFS